VCVAHLRPVADVFGPVRIVQGAHCLLSTHNAGPNCGNDAGLGLATKGVAQQPGQFGVSVSWAKTHARVLVSTPNAHSTASRTHLLGAQYST
jgi:hypothetical protein